MQERFRLVSSPSGGSAIGGRAWAECHEAPSVPLRRHRGQKHHGSGAWQGGRGGTSLLTRGSHPDLTAPSELPVPGDSRPVTALWCLLAPASLEG